ncbi:glycosyltransferase family 4 protein [Psychroserpens luteolus]|uniref:glycosyltransferase family 4 protein n=1 Tax=Psychroserpens luteolus TaxID=2855840 RepID=UPI001E5EF85A|nr:glycosyltransferase family 4 protein [Psychroserpens luteolus]MCD2259806.1 glycosyltransferase family 4 protein [Psychroserpens luteolus]
MSKIYIISKDWARSGKYSGYQKIINFLSVDFSLVRHNNLPYRIRRYFVKKTNLVNYKGENITKEFKILLKAFTTRRVHIIYGEMDYYYLKLLKKFPFGSKKNILSATFHHPPYELENRLQYNRKEVLGALDKIIVMGSNQIPFLKQYTNAEIKFIPHGIDTSYFRPPAREGERKDQIFIFGISHRDHDRNLKIINRVNEVLDLRFIIVMFEEHAKLYEHIENAEIITRNINDVELLDFYQTSKAVLMSFKECTASNVILEALATGCPLVMNNVGAVKEYITEESGIQLFETNDIEASVHYISRLFTDDNFLNDVSKKHIELAQSYTWEKVSKMTEDFLF